MLKTMLADLSKSFTKSDMKMVVVHGSDDNKIRISCHTEDKQYYVFGESMATGWMEKEFAFRDWNSISSIMSSFYSYDNPSDCCIKLDTNEENYPNVLHIQNGRMKMTHYLQNYTFISRQDDLFNTYKGKKFQLKSLDNNYFNGYDSSVMSSISKLSSLTGEKYFRVGLENGDLYFYFGDATKTIDNAKICVSTNYTVPYKDKELYFSMDYLYTAFNAMKDQDIKMKFDGGTIVVCGENEISKKVVAIVGKKDI